MTAILDKVAAGELLGRRQDMAANQLLSHALEQLLARSKRQRDTEASTLNMQLVTWRDGEAANRAFRAGAATPSPRGGSHRRSGMYRQQRRSRLGVALVSGALMVAIANPVSGQLVVYDAATTARNTITAAVKQFLFETERQQHMKLREMARRLSALTNLRRSMRWRSAALEDARRRLLLRTAVQRCIDLWRLLWVGILELSQRLLADARLLDRLTSAARRLVQARLATVNLTDAAAIAATRHRPAPPARTKR